MTTAASLLQPSPAGDSAGLAVPSAAIRDSGRGPGVAPCGPRPHGSRHGGTAWDGGDAPDALGAAEGWRPRSIPGVGNQPRAGDRGTGNGTLCFAGLQTDGAAGLDGFRASGTS